MAKTKFDKKQKVGKSQKKLIVEESERESEDESPKEELDEARVNFDTAEDLIRPIYTNCSLNQKWILKKIWSSDGSQTVSKIREGCGMKIGGARKKRISKSLFNQALVLMAGEGNEDVVNLVEFFDPALKNHDDVVVVALGDPVPKHVRLTFKGSKVCQTLFETAPQFDTNLSDLEVLPNAMQPRMFRDNFTSEDHQFLMSSTLTAIYVEVTRDLQKRFDELAVKLHVENLNHNREKEANKEKCDDTPQSDQ